MGIRSLKWSKAATALFKRGTEDGTYGACRMQQTTRTSQSTPQSNLSKPPGNSSAALDSRLCIIAGFDTGRLNDRWPPSDGGLLWRGYRHTVTPS